MRSNPSEHQLVAPASLQEALSLLADEPGAWLPISGGTDVMVQYASGKLAARKLVSIWNLPELRTVEVLPDEIRIGAGCTYTDLRQHAIAEREFPLLARAAGWTGGIANQNRGTIGGNIANASPAADSLPALLVYDADLILVSVRGQRRLPYRDFHTGYKKMKLAPDELIRAICLPRRFADYLSYSRKVGARNAQAISKVCMAALGRTSGGLADDVRIAVGSVAPIPVRLTETERVITGKTIDPSLLILARKVAAAEIRPIDDIRSTASYRSAIVGNLIAEFLGELAGRPKSRSDVLARWNHMPAEAAFEEILPCSGSRAWANEIVRRRPMSDQASLLAASDEIWRGLAESEWMEAFRSHPRIGESGAAQSSGAQSAAWSAQEQRQAGAADDAVKAALAAANRDYERQFNHIFIVCATGKSGPEILEILRRRMKNDSATELREAAEQQRQITRLRLEKWVSA